MTQENKELLIKDLSCRIPYGVIVNINGTYNNVLESVNWYYEVEVGIVSTEVYTISDVKFNYIKAISLPTFKYE